METSIDLRPWGYAPGNYLFHCADCPPDLPLAARPTADKRAYRCLDHALAEMARATSAVGAPRFLLVKRGLYYRPNNCGYTGIKEKAGRYHARDALPAAGVTAVHEDDAPEISSACFPDLAIEHLSAKIVRLEAELAELRATGCNEKARQIGGLRVG